MVMAEAERAGGGQNDMERELTCSVSFEVAGEEVGCGGRGAAGTSSGAFKKTAFLLIHGIARRMGVMAGMSKLSVCIDANCDADVRSAPTCSTNRSRCSTACTPSAAPV
jgi:hypothetical protein